jgi:molybdate transport system substrate-binding protein
MLIAPKAALTKLALWDGIEPPRATDAAAEPNVLIVAVFPEDSHPPIRYPFAIMSAWNSPETQASSIVSKAPWVAWFAAQRFGAAK